MIINNFNFILYSYTLTICDPQDEEVRLDISRDVKISNAWRVINTWNINQKRYFLSSASHCSSGLDKSINLNKITIAEKSEMDPWFVTGLTDAEGTFNISVLKSYSTKIG